MHGTVVATAGRARFDKRAREWMETLRIRPATVRSREARDRANRFYEREGYVHVKTSHVFTKPLV